MFSVALRRNHKAETYSPTSRLYLFSHTANSSIKCPCFFVKNAFVSPFTMVSVFNLSSKFRNLVASTDCFNWKSRQVADTIAWDSLRWKRASVEVDPLRSCSSSLRMEMALRCSPISQRKRVRNQAIKQHITGKQFSANQARNEETIVYKLQKLTPRYSSD
jgi:hypothetical protein